MSRKSGRKKQVINYSVYAGGSDDDDDFDVSDSKANNSSTSVANSSQNSKKRKEKIPKKDKDFCPVFEKSSESSEISEHDSDWEDLEPIKKRKSTEKVTKKENKPEVKLDRSDSKRSKKNKSLMSKENNPPLTDKVISSDTRSTILKENQSSLDNRNKNVTMINTSSSRENLKECIESIPTKPLATAKAKKSDNKTETTSVSLIQRTGDCVSPVSGNNSYVISSNFHRTTKPIHAPKPTWTPPAIVGTNASKKTIPLSEHSPASGRSPASGLRLGLSRNTKLKPLHANVKLNHS